MNWLLAGITSWTVLLSTVLPTMAVSGAELVCIITAILASVATQVKWMDIPATVSPGAMIPSFGVFCPLTTSIQVSAVGLLVVAGGVALTFRRVPGRRLVFARSPRFAARR